MRFYPVLHREPPAPIIDRIAAAFPDRGPGTIYAFAGAIYAPGGGPVSVELQAHEGVHLQRQGVTEAGAIAWWERYIAEPKFRALEELLAHRAEYFTFCRRHGQRKRRADYLAQVAARLAGPLYAGVFTEAEARRAILEARHAITEREAA
jgi:hypothetical protein